MGKRKSSLTSGRKLKKRRISSLHSCGKGFQGLPEVLKDSMNFQTAFNDPRVGLRYIEK